MHRTHRGSVPRAALCALLAAHCGGQTTITRTTPMSQLPSVPSAPPAADAGAAAPSSGPWATLTDADLERIVTEGARARLTEIVPAFDWAHLADYAEHPEHAPPLPGRA